MITKQQKEQALLYRSIMTTNGNNHECAVADLMFIEDMLSISKAQSLMVTNSRRKGWNKRNYNFVLERKLEILIDDCNANINYNSTP